ncbi:MAG: zinc-dependent metalloprotease [Flavobacteriales bacterium]|nr:zinc-dependent metalloprotease [Flavobacteriales bacterium]
MKQILLFTFTLLLAAGITFAQDTKTSDTKTPDKKKGKKGSASSDKKDEDKFGDITKKCTKSDGLFTLWRDTVSGKTYLEVKAAQLDKDYIYFNHIADAPVEAGYFRGSYGDSKVIRFHRSYERIEVLQDNTSFYYDPESALARAADANINDPLLASEKIEATSKDKTSYLLDGDAIFLSEKFQMIKFPSPPGAPPGALGSISKDKTRVEEINNYPQNTELTVAYVFENGSPGFNFFTEAIVDARNITIKYQHSLLEMPRNNFKARLDDPRLGYFTTQVTDMTSFSPTPYRDVIHRWNLEKKDPAAAISEPVEPITFWIENTTPVELRPIIKEACERWNEAFEVAGFRNAMVCKEQPDDAAWDAGDIRYNVLRWTSSPLPPFGGYGPSFVNPRTGQILGADIMLEFVAIVNRVNAEKIFKTTGFLTDEKLDAMKQMHSRNPFFCMASDMTNHDLIFGTAASSALGMDKAAEKEIVRQLLYRLVLHEVGHTLGLTHNMRASTMQSVEAVKDKEKIAKEGLANSVMEYPAFNYQLDPKQQSLYCDGKPGPYDLWVIEYGYSPAMDDPISEEYRLKQITDRSVDPRLAYGNDADDMRSSGNGIDPDVNIYDLTDDPVRYASERCDLVNTILPKLKDKFSKNNQSYQELLQAYFITTGEYGGQIRVMTRQIGGVHYDRSFPGQGSTQKPLDPVSEEDQKAAMSALSKYAFAPNAFDATSNAYNYLLEQRRGFSHFGNNQDPDIHARVLMLQSECLNHLLHRNVLQRIIDSKLYGNDYSLDEVMMDLTNSIFSSDAKTSVNTFRQNLQVEYTARLGRILDPKNNYDHVSIGMAMSELKRIDQMMAGGTSPDALTKAHRDHVRSNIKNFLEPK